MIARGVLDGRQTRRLKRTGSSKNRRSKSTILSIICLAVLHITPVLSQPSAWEITLSDGTVIPRIDLIELRHDSLVVSDTTGNRTVPVESICEIRFVREASFWKGAKTGMLIGGGAGVVIGAIAGAHLKSSPGTIFGDVDETSLRVIAAPLGAMVYGTLLGAVGATIGGTVGAVSGSDDVYDLSTVHPRGKLAAVRLILAEHEK